MKATAWSALLLALVFVIGWKSSSLVHGGVEPSRSTVVDGGREPREGRGNRGRRPGPSLLTEQHLIDQLELTADQRAALDAMIEETTEQIRTHERDIWELKDQSRRRLLALLTVDQQSRLKELLDERFQAHDEERVKAQVEWFDAQTDLSADGLERVRASLSVYEEGKHQLFAESLLDEGPRDHSNLRDEFDRLRCARDESLRQIVGDDALERFRSEQGHRGRRPPRPPSGKESPDQ